MNELPILKKNAYLTILIKDNYINANLAFTDLSAQRTYVINDITDLSPLKFRLDDIVFNKNFWWEYFNSLEKIFDWDIVDRKWDNDFMIKEFEREEVGVGGIKVIVDDNQPFFKNIYLSIKEFSKDIVLRILDDRYMEFLTNGLCNRLGYDDIVWIDMDFSHFSVFRGRKVIDIKEGVHQFHFSTSKIDWKNEIGLIDFVKSSKLNAFLSVDSSSEEISNRWANCIAHGIEYVSDQILEDVIRSFTTLELLSIKQENREKFNSLGMGNTAIFISGRISQLLKIRELLLSVIDGLELEGIFDIFIDSECKILSFGKSMIEKENAQEILILKGDILPPAYKLLIPEIPTKALNKVILAGKAYSQSLEGRDIYAIGSSINIIPLPKSKDKTIYEIELKNGVVFPHMVFQNIQFMSVYKILEYEYLIVDGRKRPVIYGPSSYENRIKLKVWGNGDKE